MHTAADARQIGISCTRRGHSTAAAAAPCGLRLSPSPGAIPNCNENERNKGETNE